HKTKYEKLLHQLEHQQSMSSVSQNSVAADAKSEKLERANREIAHLTALLLQYKSNENAQNVLLKQGALVPNESVASAGAGTGLEASAQKQVLSEQLEHLRQEAERYKSQLHK